MEIDLYRYDGKDCLTAVDDQPFALVSRSDVVELVEAMSDATDKRIKLVRITMAGEACCKDTAGLMAEAEETIRGGFSKEERCIETLVKTERQFKSLRRSCSRTAFLL